MGDTLVIIEFLLTSAIAGMVATAGATACVSMFTGFQLSASEMMQAIGSVFTRSLESSLLVGRILHFIAGIGFAMIYIIVMSMFPMGGPLWPIGMGALIGLAHGFALSFVLVVTIAEHHPIPRYRSLGIGMAVAYIMAHVVYGMLVATTVVLLGFSLR